MNKYMIGDVVKIISDFKVIGICVRGQEIFYELEEISPYDVLECDMDEIPEAALAKTTFLGGTP